nr:hypothetical protein [Tanacetum cinerariifolium]
MDIASSSGTGSLPSNTVPNPWEDLKVITTRSGITLAGPSDTSAIRDETSRNISSTSTESLEVVRQLEMMNKNFSKMMRQFQTIKTVDMKCETCGGPHSFTECPSIGGYTQETAYATTGTGSLPSNTVPNPWEDLKVITTRSGITLAGPSVSPPPPL